MKKLREKHVKKDKKKVHVSKKSGFNSSRGKVSAKRRKVVEVIFRDELPKGCKGNVSGEFQIFRKGFEACLEFKNKRTLRLHRIAVAIAMGPPSHRDEVQINSGQIEMALGPSWFGMPVAVRISTQELSYVIKEILLHPLRFRSSCNLKFKDEIKEIKQENQEEMHVFVKGNILKFFIYEFALIAGLKYFGNVEDFRYDDSSSSRLMRRYFLQSINGVDKEALVEVLFFDFKMVEDGKYEFFPWGKVAFSKLMASLRQEFFVEKQLYRLSGIHQCSYSNLVPTVEELEQLDLPRMSLHSIILMDLKFNDLEHVLNDKFSEVLKFLLSKYETVEKENITKQSLKEGEHSDDVADVAGDSNPISPHINSDKLVKTEVVKVNQEPLPIKEGPHSETVIS
ncbi:hypothetical protein T459_34639 [Capsicum annuum]|uniref:DUF1985 domain-containing protein n=1 Tax=Capsicum annuum TaxID=4072 RepID=A0A2G2XVL6_CAPAN|nr:hypothetical protein T459_34639 [Capsicum annuum]